MAYNPPVITSTGLTIPTYADILESLIEKMKTIYGQDIYLEPDSQDYQMLSAFAAKDYDTMQYLQMVYNNRSPATATGVGLDGILKINGLIRNPKAYSKADVLITGTAYTQINNGVIQDITGYKWSLPSSITIGADGTISVLATCQTAGPIVASAGDINSIVTPTYGWTSVTNPAAATLGASQEKDSAARARQALSAAIPSIGMVKSIESALGTIKTVSRKKVYENDTGSADSDGLPAHSISAVVSGGSDQDVANMIFLKKSPGVYTYGTTSVVLTDESGNTNTIRFYRPTDIYIDIVINVKKLTGYTDQTDLDIKNKLADHLSSFNMHDDVMISSLWGAALSANPSLSSPTFSILSLTAAKHGWTQETTDIAIAFNEIVLGSTEYITVNAS